MIMAAWIFAFLVIAVLWLAAFAMRHELGQIQELRLLEARRSEAAFNSLKEFVDLHQQISQLGTLVTQYRNKQLRALMWELMELHRVASEKAAGIFPPVQTSARR